MAPPPAGSKRKLVTVDAALARRIEDYRFGQRINTESEAMRRLIEMGLDRFEADTNS